MAGMNTPEADYDADTGAEHQAEGQWDQFMGKARARWADLTDDEMEQFRGNLQAAKGYIQEKYGVAKEEMEEFFGTDETEYRRAA